MQTCVLTLIKKTLREALILKLVIMLEYLNIKPLLQKAMFQIRPMKLFWFQKLENTVPWTYAISDLNGEKPVGTSRDKFSDNFLGIGFRGTSRDKLYSELSLESLANRQFYRKLISFYKIVNKKVPQYLTDYLRTQDSASINLRKGPAIYPLDTRTELYCNSFFFFLTVYHNGTTWIVI